jgi:Rod binding domain-containing protein
MEPISSLTAANRLDQLLPAARAARNEKVTEEFLAIFYKEMLKSAIKSPDLTFGNDEEKDNNSVFSSLNQDVLIEQFAKQLAKNQAARPGWLPAVERAK